MSFSLVFTPYNIPPFASKQARRSKLENVTLVKNEPSCFTSQISFAITQGSRFISVVDRRRGRAMKKSIRQSHVIARNHPPVRIPSVGNDRRRKCVSGGRYSGGSVSKKTSVSDANEHNHLQPLKH